MRLDGRCTGSADPGGSEAQCFVIIFGPDQTIAALGGASCTPGAPCNRPFSQTFALLAGRLYKLRLPLFDDDKALPTGLQSMVESMKGDYISANNQDWAQTSPIAPWEAA